MLVRHTDTPIAEEKVLTRKYLTSLSLSQMTQELKVSNLMGVRRVLGKI